MLTYEVIFTDRTTVTVTVRGDIPEHRAERVARWKAEQEYGKPAFSSRLRGCTGWDSRTHQGYSCPLHPNA